MEYQDWLLQHHWSSYQVFTFWWFMDISDPLILIGNWLTMTQQLWGSIHSSSSQVIGSSHLSIYILFFPWWVTVFHLLLILFLIYHLIHHPVPKMELSGNLPLTHWWAITYRSQKCCLVIMIAPLYRRLSASENNQVGFILSSALLSKIKNSTVWLQHHD